VNTVRVWENGPLAFHAEMSVAGDASSYRAVLCRCGLSKNKPYCDHSHLEGKFAATGEPESKDSGALSVRNGPLDVKPTKDGPLCVTGPLEVCSASGRTIARGTRQFFCRCGHSNDKPFCDGSHKMAGFKADGTA
jgi:CDGSH-type Zn-finger protein